MVSGNETICYKDTSSYLIKGLKDQINKLRNWVYARLSKSSRGSNKRVPQQLPQIASN